MEKRNIYLKKADLETAKKAARLAGHKLPVKTKIIVREGVE